MDGWVCPMCGENYRWQSHPLCLKKAMEIAQELFDLARSNWADRSMLPLHEAEERSPWLRR